MLPEGSLQCYLMAVSGDEANSASDLQRHRTEQARPAAGAERQSQRGGDISTGSDRGKPALEDQQVPPQKRSLLDALTNTRCTCCVLVMKSGLRVFLFLFHRGRGGLKFRRQAFSLLLLASWAWSIDTTNNQGGLQLWELARGSSYKEKPARKPCRVVVRAITQHTQNSLNHPPIFSHSPTFRHSDTLSLSRSQPMQEISYFEMIAVTQQGVPATVLSVPSHPGEGGG